MRQFLRRLLAPWRRQLFVPNPWLGPLANPFYVARRGLYLAMQALAPRLQGRLLDVGCGTKPYALLFAHVRYVGLEIDSPDNRRYSQADHFYDGKRLPFKNGSFDAVLINQVLEHVFEPQFFLKELKRVLRPGGQLLVTVPFAWDEHCQPLDYGRYSRFGLAHLLKKAGFHILVHVQTAAGFAAVAQLAAAAAYKVALPWPRPLQWLMHWSLIVPMNWAGVLFTALGWGGKDFYLDHVVLAQAVSAKTRKR